jgi:hypothetical protein
VVLVPVVLAACFNSAMWAVGFRGDFVFRFA